MKREKGFTIIELLTSIGIIVLLIGILLPSLMAVKKMAKNASQKAQFMAIETGLLGYRNDFGDYPPSDFTPAGGANYCGAQKLVEAMVGADLMGFNPSTLWRAEDGSYTDYLYYPQKPALSDAQIADRLKLRKSPYIELEKANVFRLGKTNSFKEEGLFNNTSSLAPEPYVFCDVYGVRKLTTGGKTVRAGTPILYYKANASSKIIWDSLVPENSIYNINDNDYLIQLGAVTSNGTTGDAHPLVDFDLFYGDENKYGDNIRYGIRDTKIPLSMARWPHNPETFILISAGPDGLYGTADDVRNFDN